MTDQLRLIRNEGSFQIQRGEKTENFIQSLTFLDDREKETLVNEAAELLSNCVNPVDTEGNTTGLAIGYVQSGKTMSFTTLTTLALDSGFRIIIYLAGIKNNLLEQTNKRLYKDLLSTSRSNRHYKIYKNLKNEAGKINEIHNALKLRNKPGILITVLKKEQHISALADLLSNRSIKSELGNNGVLIIDDEADQASLNTFARVNSKSEDWEEDQYSSTYSSIMKLRNSLPNHSFIQYTATPQAPLLISMMDVLSPEFHVVLTPGKKYTGGKVFFQERPDLIVTIPPDEVYHHKNNPLENAPSSLINALQVYLIGVAIQVNILENVSFLSMMIHADREKDASRKFYKWVNNIITMWGKRFNLEDDQDPSKIELIKTFKKNYQEAISSIESPPSFEEVIIEVEEIILDTKIYKVIEGFDEIEWNGASSHILIGAEMLNRGFTVEGLSVTYMPRNSISKSNADTIQQRCRFFGYKLNYLDSCRVYLPIQSIREYHEYIEHEEIMRRKLKSSTLRDQFDQIFVLGDNLNPTRRNILSDNIVRYKLTGWRQMNAINFVSQNIVNTEKFIKQYDYETFEDFGTDNRNHRYTKVSIDDVILFLKNFKVTSIPDSFRKTSTIVYLQYIQTQNKVKYAYIIEMAYNLSEGRERELKGVDQSDLRINNIFSGRSNDGGKTYPGDKEIKFDDSLCIQIHKIKLKHNSVFWKGKELYTLGIYYPESISHTIIGVK